MTDIELCNTIVVRRSNHHEGTFMTFCFLQKEHPQGEHGTANIGMHEYQDQCAECGILRDPDSLCRNHCEECATVYCLVESEEHVICKELWGHIGQHKNRYGTKFTKKIRKDLVWCRGCKKPRKCKSENEGFCSKCVRGICFAKSDTDGIYSIDPCFRAKGHQGIHVWEYGGKLRSWRMYYGSHDCVGTDCCVSSYRSGWKDVDLGTHLLEVPMCEGCQRALDKGSHDVLKYFREFQTLNRRFSGSDWPSQDWILSQPRCLFFGYEDTNRPNVHGRFNCKFPNQHNGPCSFATPVSKETRQHRQQERDLEHAEWDRQRRLAEPPPHRTFLQAMKDRSDKQVAYQLSTENRAAYYRAFPNAKNPYEYNN